MEIKLKVSSGKGSKYYALGKERILNKVAST